MSTNISLLVSTEKYLAISVSERIIIRPKQIVVNKAPQKVGSVRSLGTLLKISKNAIAD